VSSLVLFTLAGAGLFAAGVWGVVVRAHLFWKVLGFNVAGSGVFLILIAAPPRLDPSQPDPVPEAMVLTGIVVAVAATAVALGMSLRVAARKGEPFLEDEE